MGRLPRSWLQQRKPVSSESESEPEPESESESSESLEPESSQSQEPEVSSEWLEPPLDSPSPWEISIFKKLEQGRDYEAASSHRVNQSIYRIPKPVRDIDEDAYTPQIVAIGPYHRGKSHLCNMERHKWRALHMALHREGHDLNYYLKACRRIKFRARIYYEANLSISTDKFVECLVIDAVFILELFRGVYKKEGFPGLGYHRKDRVFTVPGIMHLFQRDMIKLENQLPFFVLDRILALQKGYTSTLLTDLALYFFGNLLPANRHSVGESYYISLECLHDVNPKHCLDFFHRNLLVEGPKKSTRVPFDELRYFNHSATELRAAGFKFRPVELSNRFWDIKFQNGVLHIPTLTIDMTTKYLFLNLIAFEHCHLKHDKHISTYVMFMNKLINSEEDVRYLRRKKIIENFLGNYSEVADLFNLLHREVLFNIETCYLSDLLKQMNDYYNQRRNVWRATFMQKYFNNPWAIISLLAGGVLLLLTFGQTIYTIYDYYKPN